MMSSVSMGACNPPKLPLSRICVRDFPKKYGSTCNQLMEEGLSLPHSIRVSYALNQLEMRQLVDFAPSLMSYQQLPRLHYPLLDRWSHLPTRHMMISRWCLHL